MLRIQKVIVKWESSIRIVEKTFESPNIIMILKCRLPNSLMIWRFRLQCATMVTWFCKKNCHIMRSVFVQVEPPPVVTPKRRRKLCLKKTANNEESELCAEKCEGLQDCGKCVACLRTDDCMICTHCTVGAAICWQSCKLTNVLTVIFLRHTLLSPSR